MREIVDPLSVDVALDVTVDGTRCAVWNEDGRIVVNAPTLTVARSLLGGVEATPLDQSQLVEWLTQTTLTVELRVRHATVARLGADVTPSGLAKRAGYDAALSVRGLGVAAWRALL